MKFDLVAYDPDAITSYGIVIVQKHVRSFIKNEILWIKTSAHKSVHSVFLCALHVSVLDLTTEAQSARREPRDFF
jgi:hypothetical protein